VAVMRRFSIILLATAAVAVAPASASAQTTGQTIPTPDPILTKLGHTPMVELWDGGGGLPYLGASASYNAGNWEPALELYHDSGVYNSQLAKVDAVAQQWLRRAGKAKSKFHFKAKQFGHSARRAMLAIKHHGKHGKHGKKHGSKKAAIVFDIDETTLSNYSAIQKDGFTFGTNSQNEAVDKIGVAIDPSLALFNLAKKKHIAIFLITGRRENVRTPTAENLAEQGYTGYKQLILRPQDGTGTTVDYKSGERAKIERQGYRIVANVGDQYSDLAGGHSGVAFKLPNPFYFLP
jgi:predicted secreted acid phosphatase